MNAKAKALVEQLISEGPAAKPIHGAPVEKNRPADMQDESPVPFDFKVGDPVIYTNDNGLSANARIRGFASDPSQHGGRFVYLLHRRPGGEHTPGGAWHFPVHPKSVTAHRPLS